MGSGGKRIMNPKRVVLEGTDKEVGWMCECGTVYSSEFLSSEESAMRCCTPITCKGCGVTIVHGALCHECNKKRTAEHDDDLYRRAEKILLKDYAGKVVWREGDWGEDGFMSMDEVHDMLEDEPKWALKWAWATTPTELHLNARDVVAQELESQEHHEYAYESISEDRLNKLQRAMDVFCKEANIVSYTPDHSRVVLFDVSEEVAVACGSMI